MEEPISRTRTDVFAIETVGCRDCGAYKGYPCTYLKARYPAAQRKPPGTAMQSVHAGRRHAVKAALARRQRKEDAAATLTHTYLTAEREERRQLVLWLSGYHRILTDKTLDVV